MASVRAIRTVGGYTARPVQLFVTVLEESVEDAVRAIRELDLDHDGIEVRAERWGGSAAALAAIRAATTKPVILTHRGRTVTPDEIAAAIDAGIELVDVEWSEGVDVGPRPERVVLSHHDFEGMGDVEVIAERMRGTGSAHLKLAVTPRRFADNERLLRLLDRRQPPTVIGMGEQGLYTRILAPFRGSPLAFAAASSSAAPGQLTLRRALEIYGPHRDDLKASTVFAVAGNPAGHSRSPDIHNRLFREKGVRAAYTIAAVGAFGEIEEAFLRGEPRGLSVTAPFKEDALRFAQRIGAAIAPNAAEAGAVNTLVHGASIVADNTDVDGFSELLRRICGRDRKSVAIIGGGGTARAAVVASRREGLHAAVFNRTPGKLGAWPLEDLQSWDGEIVIDTTPVDPPVAFRAGMSYIRAAYGESTAAVDRARAAGVEVFDGLDLLEAQAVRQNELFAAAARAAERVR